MPREVVEDGITWSCIQAFAGLGNDPEKAQAARNATAGPGLRVICEGWEPRLTDRELLAAIHSSLE